MEAVGVKAGDAGVAVCVALPEQPVISPKTTSINTEILDLSLIIRIHLIPVILEI
jgi:hypothetical protein